MRAIGAILCTAFETLSMFRWRIEIAKVCAERYPGVGLLSAHEMDSCVKGARENYKTMRRREAVAIKDIVTS